MATVETSFGAATLPVLLKLPNKPEATEAARRALATLRAEIPTEVFRNAMLLVTELIANVVRHSGQDDDGWVELEATVRPQKLEVAVRDGGKGFRPVIEPSVDRGGGFGLYMVDAMAERWGVRCSPGRNEVWLELAW